MKVRGDLSTNVEDRKSFTCRPSDLQNYTLVLCTFKNDKSMYKNIKSVSTYQINAVALFSTGLTVDL